jgi:hypothetical protein
MALCRQYLIVLLPLFSEKNLLRDGQLWPEQRQRQHGAEDLPLPLPHVRVPTTGSMRFLSRKM